MKRMCEELGTTLSDWRPVRVWFDSGGGHAPVPDMTTALDPTRINSLVKLDNRIFGGRGPWRCAALWGAFLMSS